MRSTFRLLASVKPARYFEAGNPTGLTGLYTHGSPRSSLLYLYSSTLDKLKAVPESSLYRQSVEAVTKHRLAVVEAAEPPGYKEWVVKAQQILKEHPEEFRVSNPSAVDGASIRRVEGINGSYVFRHEPPEKDERYEEWDGELDEGPELEGLRTAEERKDQEKLFTRKPLSASRQVKWEPEPQLTADQIEEIETKIGAGLIEEVIQVAEAEHNLIDTMIQSKVWEPLEEKPAEGQWTYFERKN